MKKLLLSALLLLTLPLHAKRADEPTFDPRWWRLRCWELGGEFLLMKPARCDTEFAVIDPRAYVPPSAAQPSNSTEEFGPHGAIKAVESHFEPGFRVMVGRAFGCRRWDLRIEYMRLHTRDCQTFYPCPDSGGIWASEVILSNPAAATPPNFFQVVLFNPSGDSNLPGEVGAFAAGCQKFSFDGGDVELGIRTTCRDKLWLRGTVGLHWIVFNQQLIVNYQGTLHPGIDAATSTEFQSRALFATVHRNGKTWGVGPKVKVEGVYDCGGCFSLAARVGITFLAGEQQARYFQILETFFSETETLDVRTSYDLTTGNQATVVPVVDGRLGLNYRCCARSMEVNVQAGWEWLSYIYLLPAGPRFRIDRGISQLDCENFNLTGLYIRIFGSF